MPNEDELLNAPSFTVRELAKRYGVTVNTIKAWAREGRFNSTDGRPGAYRVNGIRGRWHITQEGVERFEQSAAQTTAEEDWGRITVFVTRPSEG